MPKKSGHNETPANNGDEWSAWAVAAQAGDKRAYGKLLSESASFIKSYLLSSLANPDWVDDVTQEVLISVHKSLSTYSPDRPYKPWLMAIARFRRTDFLRKHYNKRDHKSATMDDAEFLKSHVTNPSHAGEYKDIEAALAALPDKQGRVFRLMKIEGYSAKEVANEMGMSVSAVKVSARRTMAKLKKTLG